MYFTDFFGQKIKNNDLISYEVSNTKTVLRFIFKCTIGYLHFHKFHFNIILLPGMNHIYKPINRLLHTIISLNHFPSFGVNLYLGFLF